jgi:hypothetical protein
MRLFFASGRDHQTFLETAEPGLSRLDLLCLLGNGGSKDLWRDYYGFDPLEVPRVSTVLGGVAS